MPNASKLTNKGLNEENMGRIISRLTEPIIWIPLVLWIVLEKLQSSLGKIVNYYFITLFFFFIVPFGYALFVIFIKKDLDIDISDKSKRIKFAVLPMLSFAIGVTITYFIDKQFFIITLAAFMSTMLLVVITHLFKISYHSGLNALYFYVVNYLYNWHFWWLFLLLIPISWGRWTMKKHTIMQLFAGVIVSTFTFFLITKIFLHLS